MSRWRDGRPWDDRTPPPWWPRDEPWPPRGGRLLRERQRARFVRRSGWYSFWPLWVLLSVIASSSGRRGFGGVFPFGGGIALLLACAAVAGAVAIIIRRIASPVADLVSAADRIAHRDFDVRVREPGFGPAWIGDTARAFNAMAKELDAQDKARRHLMADIAHELRTPLAIVQGKLEGILDGVYPRDDERLQGLLEDTRVMARLVEDLRTLSTAESGALALSKEPTDIVALAHDVILSLSAHADAAGVALRVEIDSQDDIQPIAIDPMRIREVLTNLVANALRYTPRGGRVLVRVGTRADGVDVRVADNGAGMSEEELPRIFDRFYKGPGSAGSGLGLTIARGLVEAHGGAIRAESQLGVGTTIVLSLPR
jgi:two-component system sensor histidine kinase BaeS